MNSEFLTALNEIAEEKGLDKDEVLKMIEASLAAAFRKDYGEKDQNPVVELDPETMAMKIYDVKTVVAEVIDPQKEILEDDAKKIKKSYKLGDGSRTQCNVLRVQGQGTSAGYRSSTAHRKRHSAD